MTEDGVQALPVIVDLATAARALGLGRNTAHELVRSRQLADTGTALRWPHQGPAQQPDGAAWHESEKWTVCGMMFRYRHTVSVVGFAGWGAQGT
jgi:hypothetical protein